MKEFFRTFKIIWADLDPNRHMRHTAYNDYAAQVRIEFFASQGLDIKRLSELGVGPILFREDTKFKREVHMNETIKVTFELSAFRENGYKWGIRHNIFKENDELACTIDTSGAWLDLNLRKIVIPPDEVANSLKSAPKSEDFQLI